MKVVERYIRKPHLVLSFVILLSVVGMIGYKKMPFNLFPDTDRPQISVVTVMPGAAAADVETDITRIIEEEVSTIDLVRKVISTSKDEVSVVSAEFEYDKGLDAAATDVANALSKVGARLPPAIRSPQIFKISQAIQPTMTLALSPASGSPVDLRKIRELADNPIREALLRVPDIANVEVFGAHQPEVQVTVDPDRLDRFAVGLPDVMGALSAQNQNIPQGLVIRRDGQYLFKTEGAVKNPDELKGMVVARRDTGTIHLRDVADVGIGVQEPQSAYHGNGREAIGINILRGQNGHTLDAIHGAERLLPKLKTLYPFIRFDVSYTQKDLIDLSVTNMLEALRDAILITVVVIFLFLGMVLLYFSLVPAFRSFVHPLTIMSAIPLALIGAIWSLLVTGKHQSTAAFMGVILLAGIVVKNSILLIDFIEVARERGASTIDALRESVRVRTRPILMTAFGTAVGMVPIALEWAIGLERLSPLAMVAIGGLMVSTFLTLLYVPIFYTLFEDAILFAKGLLGKRRTADVSSS